MKLPILSGHDVIKILSRQGFNVARQKESHIILIMESASGKKSVVVPNHKEIDKGTLLEIIRQSGMTKEEFINLNE